MSANKGETRAVQPTRAQQTLARRAAESRATVPVLELSGEAEMTATMATLATDSVSWPALAVRACALALTDVPRANAAYRDGNFELYERINVGVALPSSDAIVIPTVFDADGKALATLNAELADLSERARRGQLSPPELSGATFTLWIVDNDAVLSTSPLIVPPQASAISVGAVRAVPVMREGRVVPGHTAAITLACDHRILYGDQAAAFLGAVLDRLENGVT
jgi:pyruvate dehydrogenase E2 component (dihydrolipoyllysine-residue acetyltransferase)